jgi:hypothetical protein
MTLKANRPSQELVNVMVALRGKWHGSYPQLGAGQLAYDRSVSDRRIRLFRLDRNLGKLGRRWRPLGRHAHEHPLPLVDQRNIDIRGGGNFPDRSAGHHRGLSQRQLLIQTLTPLTCPPGLHQHGLEPGGFVAHERGLSNGLRSGARRA